MRSVPNDRPATPVHRLAYVDGLRALAALWVAVHHAIETSEPTAALAIPVVGPVLASLFFGQFPVMVFLMLSGFCLYYPYVRKRPSRPEFTTGYRAYLVRRAKRIAPPYLWAGAFCLAMAAIPALQVGRWGKVVGPIDTGTVVSHLLFFHNLVPRYASKIDYPMWSIGLEWQLYLLFPLLMWAFNRVGGVVTMLATLAVAAAIRGTYHRIPEPMSSVQRYGPFSYLEIFAAGMLVATLIVRRVTVAPRWLLWAAVVVGLGLVRFGSGNGLVHDLATSAAAFSILLLAAEAGTGASRTLSTPWLVSLGVFSYSLYLVHAPLLHLGWLALSGLHLSSDAIFGVLVVIGMPAIVLISYGFHCLFERPFMRVAPAAPASTARAVAE
jgi:peptidoglycan/LPS O-acetylase OafA/YrhL